MNKMAKKISILISLMLLLLAFAGCVKVTSSKDVIDEKVTERKSEKVTEKTTEKPTEKVTEKVTEKETEKATEKTTEKATEKVTEKVTENVTEKEYPYVIKVNRACNCITVYENDKPVKAFACSVGKYVPSNPNSEPTPVGTFAISDKYEWGLMVDGSYGRYACRIVSDILFHSVPYLGGRVKDGLETDQYNLLGEEASLGCVRLNVRDAKWIYENCDKGTTVIIYDDPSNPGPLGKPDSIRIPMDSPYKGWDPTEDDPANPWNNFSARIECEDELSLIAGSKKEDLLEKIKAYDKCGNDITGKLTLDGTYDLDKEGEYEINLSVVDATGSKADKKVKLTIISVKEKDTKAHED